MSPEKSTMCILAQILALIPNNVIPSLIEKYRIRTRGFDVASHFAALVIAQLSHSVSLNDICDNLKLHAGILSQIRNCVPPSRNALSHANRTRNADLVEELYYKIEAQIRKTDPDFFNGSRRYPGLPHRFKKPIHAADSTTIQLTINSIDWARHRRQKAAAKMHTRLDMHSFLPSFAIVKSAKPSDARNAWELCAGLKAGEIVVFDKAYVDSDHLYSLDSRGVAWVTRAKDNMQYRLVGGMDGEVSSSPKTQEDPAPVRQGQEDKGPIPSETGVPAADGKAFFSAPATLPAGGAELMGQHLSSGGGCAAQGEATLSPASPEPSGGPEIVGQHPSDEVRHAAKGKTGQGEAASGRPVQGSAGPDGKRKRSYRWKRCEVLSDERIVMARTETFRKYPKEFRLITARVEVKKKMVEMRFITNNMEWKASSVCQLYQCRWGIEVFFKELKQTLQVSDFLGYNENAVRWQIWTALIVYLVMRLVAWKHHWKHHFSRLLTLVRATLWNFFKLASVLAYCDLVAKRTPRKRAIRGSPETLYQLTFWDISAMAK